MLDKGSLIFCSESGDKFKLTEKTLSEMKKYVQTNNDEPESGGVLLGRYILNSNDVIVDLITIPQVKDIQKRTFFFKNKEEHQSVIDAIWKLSKGTCNYLGEWHTHPQDHPIPSSLDLRTWKRQVKETKFEGKKLFYVILGRKSVSAFNVIQASLNVEKLTLCKTTNLNN